MSGLGLKIAALIVCGASTGAGLLVVRQQRLLAVSEMTASIHAAERLDIETWHARARIARSTAWAEIEALAAESGIERELPAYGPPMPALADAGTEEVFGW